MAWESRKRGGRYYTRPRRVNGKVKREYIPLAVASFVAQTDAMEREERAIEAEERRWEAEAREAYARSLFAPLDALDAICEAAIAAELTAAGYYRHKREWRRRRGQHSTSQAA